MSTENETSQLAHRRAHRGAQIRRLHDRRHPPRPGMPIVWPEDYGKRPVEQHPVEPKRREEAKMTEQDFRALARILRAEELSPKT